MVKIPVSWRGMRLNLHLAAAYYLGGVSPEVQWSTRGISGHEPDAVNSAALKEQKASALKKLNEDTVTRRAAQVYVDECAKVMDGLMSKGNAFLKNYLGKRDFKFILGAMRTGGTYIYKELSEVYGLAWKSYNMEMTHDSIPTYVYLANYTKPEVYLAVVFDFAQYLVWVKREVENSVVVQKRIAYAHALPIVNSIFGDSAEYIVTVRHPVSIAYSFAKVHGNNARDHSCPEPESWQTMVNSGNRSFDSSEWRDLSYFERVMYYWERYYTDIANNVELVENIHFLEFGEEMSEFISSRAEKISTIKTDQEPFSVSPRLPDEELDFSQWDEIYGNVKNMYALKAKHFPTISTIR